MTTNSPNPVDSDAQALIERATTLIAKGNVLHREDPFYELDVNLLYIALASLTAEPKTPACFVTYWPDTGDESYREHSESNERCARRIASEIGGYVRQCFIVDDGLKVYTTPPAQLLRPVELPGYTDRHQCMSTACDAAYEYKLSVIEALRQQGYEVKS